MIEATSSSLNCGIRQSLRARQSAQLCAGTLSGHLAHPGV